jgi:hypothetical protein
VKVNPEWDVWEYLEWKFKWEQLFTFNAIERLDIESKLPTKEQIEELIWEDYGWFLMDNNIKFCGWRNPYNKKFNSIDGEFDIWCEGGSVFYGDFSRWNHYNVNDIYGFSVRCV